MKPEYSRWFFLAFFVTSIVIFGLLMKLFWVPVGLAIIITVTCSPIYRWFHRWMRYRYLAAFLTTLAVFLLVVVPLGSMMGVLITQVLKFFQTFAMQLQDGSLATTIDQVSRQLVEWLNHFIDVDPANFDLRASLITFAKSAGHTLYQYSPKVLGSTLHLMLNVVLCLFFVFVFFADGGALYKMVVNALPISFSHEKQITTEVRQMVTATLLGMIINAVANGILIGLAFWVCGLPKPVMWGIVAIGFSLIPVVGAVTIWGGGALVLLLHGQSQFAIGMTLYGLVVIAQVDNVVKPLVMGNKVKIHPALLLISLLGGVNLFGLSGLVFGPVMLALIMAAFRIYQEEFAPKRV
jgi:predicted PurR-regulated permease PerM